MRTKEKHFKLPGSSTVVENHLGKTLQINCVRCCIHSPNSDLETENITDAAINVSPGLAILILI